MKDCDTDEEARQKEVGDALASLNERYKVLFGIDPDEHLPFAEKQNRIADEMARKGQRPYIL